MKNELNERMFLDEQFIGSFLVSNQPEEYLISVYQNYSNSTTLDYERAQSLLALLTFLNSILPVVLVAIGIPLNLFRLLVLSLFDSHERTVFFRLSIALTLTETLVLVAFSSNVIYINGVPLASYSSLSCKLTSFMFYTMNDFSAAIILIFLCDLNRLFTSRKSICRKKHSLNSSPAELRFKSCLTCLYKCISSFRQLISVLVITAMINAYDLIFIKVERHVGREYLNRCRIQGGDQTATFTLVLVKHLLSICFSFLLPTMGLIVKTIRFQRTSNEFCRRNKCRRLSGRSEERARLTQFKAYSAPLIIGLHKLPVVFMGIFGFIYFHIHPVQTSLETYTMPEIVQRLRLKVLFTISLLFFVSLRVTSIIFSVTHNKVFRRHFFQMWKCERIKYQSRILTKIFNSK